jgi:hypothetical protein
VNARSLAARATALALEAGFDLAGVAAADAPKELAFFAEWIARGHAGEMSYLTTQAARRSDLHAWIASGASGRRGCSTTRRTLLDRRGARRGLDRTPGATTTTT